MRTPQTGQALAALYVRSTPTRHLRFWGPIEEWQTQIIWTTLGPFLLGRDPLASELLFDQMARLDRHGRSGYFMAAVSAIDCALWDLKGKALGQPVYRLLGGPTRAAVPAYASMLGFPTDSPADAAAVACGHQGAGLHRAEVVLPPRPR
ncbi:MAG: hypothetical protein R3A10_19695 [Caldilineaceae bacterium]